MAQQNAEQELQNMTYSNNTDFNVFITTMRNKLSCANALGATITDENFRIIILNALPPSWDLVVAALYGDVSATEAISWLETWYTRISRHRAPHIRQSHIAL